MAATPLAKQHASSVPSRAASLRASRDTVGLAPRVYSGTERSSANAARNEAVSGKAYRALSVTGGTMGLPAERSVSPSR
jgi:hypothetical protein